VVTSLLLLLVIAAPAAAQQSPYVDPALRALLQSPIPDQTADALGVAVRRTAFDAPRVGLFARIRDESAISAITSGGGTIGTRVGRLITADVPVTLAARLAQSPAFEVIEVSRTVSVSHDSSMKAIRADMVRQVNGGVWSGTAGQGVIVAIYDTGLDFFHDDFRDANGQTRVLALWDQTAFAGTPPTGFGYGNLCTRAQIQQALNTGNPTHCAQTDSNGHGTHVAGSAAGDGSATGNGVAPFSYPGVAPLADLMIVKGGNGLFSESSIMDGLRWLEQQSRALNRPMVVNLSIGGQTGAHDGSRLYEILVDSLSRPGFVIVIAATNDGVNGNDKNPDGTEPSRNPLLIHGSGMPGATRDHTFEVASYTPLPGGCNDFATFSFWYEPGDQLEITMVRPDGSSVTAPFGQLVERDGPAGNVRIDNVENGTANPSNGAYEADIRINDCGSSQAAPLSGIWTLRVTTVSATSNQPYHFWLYSQGLGGGAFARGRTNFDNRFVVGSPGNARSAITVGAFTSRNCWPSPAKPEGPVCFVTMEQVGDIARFSSPGPTRDGRIKPEITAPGIAIASALSRAAGPAANRILPDGVHTVNQGTSMAAPHVTGAIALLLQHRPTLDAAAIRQIFSATAEQDIFTARSYAFSPEGVPTDWWGFGKLNVCAALGALGTSGSGNNGPVVITPATDTLPVNAVTRFFTCSPSAASVQFASSDPAVATVDQHGTVRARALGSARIIAFSGTFADTAFVVVTAPAQLDIASTSAAPQATTLGSRGTVLPLLSTTLRATGHEAMRVRTLGYRVSGTDAGAHLLLIADLNRNRRYDAGERIIERQAIALAGTVVDVDVAIDSLTIAQRDSLYLIMAIELSGAAPNGAAFQAELLPQRTRTTGVRSQAADQLGSVSSVASSSAASTVLRNGLTFSLSENPVRTGRVVFNFAERPKVAAIYTLNGRRVIDLLPAIDAAGSVSWNLRNGAGDRVAPGVYFVVFDVAGRLEREKLFIMGGAQ
jgi:subtilisin family serine protease